MKILSLLSEKLIKTAHAISLEDVGTTMCYLGTADLRSTTISLLQWVMCIFSPLLALMLAIKNGFNLLKRKAFSLYYAIYKSFLRVIIAVVISFIILIIVYIFVVGSIDTTLEDKLSVDMQLADAFSSLLTLFGIVILLIFAATAIGYLFFSFKNRAFLKIFLSYIFVVPSIIIFLMVLIFNLVPSFNKYLPEDALIFKKKQLRDKLVKEDKIPSDTQKKP